MYPDLKKRQQETSSTGVFRFRVIARLERENGY